MDADGPGAGSDDPRGDAAAGPDTSHERADGPDRRARAGVDPLGGRRAEQGTDADEAAFLRVVRATSVFDEVRLAGRPADHRFGRVRPAEVRDGRRERSIELRTFDSPEFADAGVDEGFDGVLADQLARWAAVGDLEGVVRPLDAGDEPVPWVATAPVAETLADRDRTLETALRESLRLGRALAAMHDRSTVHAGIDPANVVYPEGEGGPRFDGVGLVDVYRRYADPAGYLDARYAAPEYFETEPGVVDRATDVYQLGALVFRLCTGQPPVDGTTGEIRDRVTSDEPLPRPSTIEARLPAAVDDVLLRATATEKFDRYDTAREFCLALYEAVEELLE